MNLHILKLDRDRELHFGFKAMRKLRLKFGDNKSIDQMMNLKVDEIPALVFIGLSKDDPKLTEAQLDDLLDDTIGKTYTMMDITTIVLKALQEQLGTKPDEEEDSKKAPAGDQKTKVEVIPEVETATVEKKQPKLTIPSTKKLNQ